MSTKKIDIQQDLIINEALEAVASGYVGFGAKADGVYIKFADGTEKKLLKEGDAGAGGLTPADDLLYWDAANSKYKPFAGKKSTNPGYAYLYTGNYLTAFPTFTNPILLDGLVYATQFRVYSDQYGSKTFAALYTGGIIINRETASIKNNFSQYVNTDGTVCLVNIDALNNKYFPIKIGATSEVGNYHGEFILIDDYNRTADIHMTHVKLSKGLPVYADNAAAIAGGLAVNELYRKSTGEVMIVF